MMLRHGDMPEATEYYACKDWYGQTLPNKMQVGSLPPVSLLLQTMTEKQILALYKECGATEEDFKKSLAKIESISKMQRE